MGNTSSPRRENLSQVSTELNIWIGLPEVILVRIEKFEEEIIKGVAE